RSSTSSSNSSSATSSRKTTADGGRVGWAQAAGRRAGRVGEGFGNRHEYVRVACGADAPVRDAFRNPPRPDRAPWTVRVKWLHAPPQGYAGDSMSMVNRFWADTHSDFS